MTKAETIFKNIRKSAIDFISSHYYTKHRDDEDFNPAVRFTMDNTDGYISQRTVNAVQKQLDKYIADVKRNYRFGVIDKEQLLKEAEIVRLVRTGIEDGQEKLDWLKGLAS